MIDWIKENYPALCKQFFSFTDSEEYDESELITLVSEFDRDCEEKVIELVGRDIGYEINKLADDVSYCREISGYIEGFTHAMRLVTECGRVALVTADGEPIRLRDFAWKGDTV